MMKSLSLTIEILPPNEITIIDRIKFRGGAFVVPQKGTEISEVLEKTDGLIFLDEIVRSLKGDGLYLIFTSASGIADEAGWAGVKVTYSEAAVFWQFEIEETNFNWNFPVDLYTREVEELKMSADMLPKGVVLEPSQVIFPEDW